MAHVSCAAQVAANIGADCVSPAVGGFTGRGVYIPKSYAPTLTKSSTNPRIISAIVLESGQKTFAIENLLQNPFNGGTVTSNAETGLYTKTVALRVPQHGADVAKNIIEPLLKAPLGGIVILERLDTNGDGSFVVYGAERGMKASEQTLNEYENNGDWAVTLSTDERFAEVCLYDTDYATSLEKFEALLSASY